MNACNPYPPMYPYLWLTQGRSVPGEQGVKIGSKQVGATAKTGQYSPVTTRNDIEGYLPVHGQEGNTCLSFSIDMAVQMTKTAKIKTPKTGWSGKSSR